MKIVRLFALVLSLGFASSSFANSSLADYLAGGNGIIGLLTILEKDAGSCGFVGRMVAGRMGGSIRDQRTQMANVSAAVKQGARAPLEAALKAVEEGNEEMRGSTNMIRNGLSTNSADCKRASAAFERLIKLSFAQPAKIRRLISEL